MGFATPFKFGLPGSELSLTGALEPFTDDIQMNFGRIEAVNENILGETFVRVFRRTSIRFAVKIQGASEDEFHAIRSLYMIPHSHLSLIYAGPHKVFSERYTMESATTFKMVTNSHIRLDKDYFSLAPPGAAQVSILGVFDDYSPLGAQVSTNRFSTFNRANWEIAINVSKAIGDPVYVNWTFTGALVRIESFSARQYSINPVTGDISWDLTLALRGV